jgi:D-psicose/D-tagatose/L-ribulose 3-epimerase
MEHPDYAFPLAIQTILPEEYRGVAFRQKLALLRELGFSGVELNVVCPEGVDPVDLRALLAEYGLEMTMFATGATAKAEGLSLSDPDEGIRLASIQRCAGLIDFASEFGAGVIVGFLKGGLSADREGARALFLDSLVRLDAHIRAKEVLLLIEATNRYESAVANTLHDAAGAIQALQNPFLRILPDTFHMNIEERNMFGSLARYWNLFDSLHLSDNNRFFPGLGAIDFFAVLRFLKDAGYSGRVAIEGNICDSFEDDLRASMSILRPMLLQV